MPRAPARQTPEELAAAHDYLCELWWVHLTPPARGLFAAEGHELTAVIAALIVCARGGGLPNGYAVAPTTDPAQRWVDLGAGMEWLVCHEGMMREVMACVRRNGLHGAYRKAGTERVYQF
ncbi:hypothetical protein [Parolsenella catena]|uniref:hypothetical protein n=1 Tax=Parolsenella catena TaxID=2003188 RepID=UPI003A93F2BB